METHLNGSFARIYDCSMRDLQQFTHNSSLAKKNVQQQGNGGEKLLKQHTIIINISLSFKCLHAAAQQ